ncbi:MAG TPA: M48 family metallopeptidase [Acidimicrobiales bacterium]|nr:M48 family metallopeptidase [Acidimicrobiales bacterium]
MTIEVALKYPGISAQGFAHPADRAATAAIHTVPSLDKFIKFFTEHGYERRMRQLLLGNAVRVGDEQLPAVWTIQRRCANTLDIDRCPRLYVTQEPVGNGLTIGSNEPVTLVSSGLVASYPEDELTATLAHEMGHVLADHVGLTTTFQLVQMVLRGVLRTVPLAGIPLVALYLALLEWSRAAELTSDRASAIVTGDPLAMCRTLMRMAGGPIKDLNVDAFIRQATEYEGEADPFSRYSRFFAEITTTHPFPVRRVRELIAWVSAGELDRIRSGSYLRKGQEPPPSREFEAAFEHYRKRFSTIVDRAGDGIASVLDRLTTWLGGSEQGVGADTPSP